MMPTSSSTHKPQVAIIGTGSYLPERVVTNHDLEKIVQTSDEWIFTRTGMRERRIAAPEQATSDLGALAAERALADAGVAPLDIDMLICATITKDRPFPNTAALIQHKIGAARAFCFDIEAACSGSLYALEVARNFIVAGGARTVLVVGAEKMSSILNWTDRTTCVLFGDGAGAVVLRAEETPNCLLETVMGTDGSLAELLMIPGGGSRMPLTVEVLEKNLHCLTMAGKETFKHAISRMTNAAQTVLERGHFTAEDIRWVIPHQANMRIIQAIADRLHVPMEKLILNVERVGNTSGASTLIAMDEAAKDGRLRPGDLILMCVFGGGFTWGANLFRWYKS